MKKIFLVVLLLPISIFAYENEYFSMDIDDSYNEVQIKDNVYSWTNKNTSDIPNIVVSIFENKNDNLQSIKDYTTNDLNNYKTSLENKYNSELSEYNIQITIKNLTKKKINNYISLYYEAYSNTKDYYGFDIYQYSYTFTTNNYITTVTYTNTENKNELEELISTFKIKDTLVKEKSFFEYKKNKVLVILLFIGIVIIIVFNLLFRKHIKKSH